jgi:hypothetical protein
MTSGEEHADGEAPEACTSPVGRRAVMRMVGAGAAAAGLAGCQGISQQSYEFTADPVVLGKSARSEQGYTETSNRTVTSKRTESVGGVEAEVTVHSQVAIYSSERDTEPLDIEGLWRDDDGTLAAWTDGAPARGARASDLVDGESLVAQSGDGEATIPAAAAQVWAPNTKFDELSVEDLLVAVSAGDVAESLPPLPYDERDRYGFDSSGFFPAGTALDLESGVFVAGREGM